MGGQNTKGTYQLTLQSTDFGELTRGCFALLDKLKANAKLIDVNTDLQVKNPQANVEIDREKAYSLGISAKQIDAHAFIRLWFIPDFDNLHAKRPVQSCIRSCAQILQVSGTCSHSFISKLARVSSFL